MKKLILGIVMSMGSALTAIVLIIWTAFNAEVVNSVSWGLDVLVLIIGLLSILFLIGTLVLSNNLEDWEGR